MNKYARSNSSKWNQIIQNNVQLVMKLSQFESKLKALQILKTYGIEYSKIKIFKWV